MVSVRLFLSTVKMMKLSAFSALNGAADLSCIRSVLLFRCYAFAQMPINLNKPHVFVLTWLTSLKFAFFETCEAF